MNEPTSSSVASLPPFTPPAPKPAAQPFDLPIRFTGSGSEYFRIWIVNLLLTLITLTLYHPWAKVRRLRYFYANTLVGDQPLGFHADPWKILRGYLLVGTLLIIYSVSGRLSQTAGFLAFLLIAALWPAFLKSAMQFRLANTSWRGLRFRFNGTLGGAYKALLPWFIPGSFLIGGVLLVPDREHPPLWFGALTGLTGLALLVLMPLLFWNLKKYQHDHFVFGPLQTQLRARVGQFYGVFAKTVGVALLALLVLGMTIGAVAAAFYLSRSGGRGMAAALMLGGLAFFFGFLLVQLVPGPFFKSRMQNLLWSRTGNRSMHFNSSLRFWPLFRLTLKNWCLIVLTLGFYWPFAAVAIARIKLEAMSVTTRIDPQTLADEARAAEGDATGDAAGDLFGLDIGF